jgi:glycosyltransferase involved in cell wall biosynthesis
MANPLLSVCVITYNHGPFIRQSLDSVAMQQVNFDMELIIADDKSKDDTTAIIEDFIKTYPGKVIFLKREENLGPADNFIDMINTATGKYVAYMEGDDYWTHPKKLQMQVDFLEKNESVALSSHNSTILLKNGETYPYNRDERYAKGPYEAVYKAEDYIVKDFFHSSAIMYRRSALTGFPSWYREAFGGDYFLVLFVTMKGDIHYINEPLSVYRIHGKSVSNFSSRYEIFKNFKRHFEKFDEYSNYKYHKLMSRKSFAFEFGFYYYHPKYLKKWWFAITNLHKIVQLSPSVISRWARYKIFVPTVFLRSKVNLFTKMQA